MEVSLGEDKRQTVWIAPESTNRTQGRWLIVIHGGAWRDPNITWKSGVNMAETLASKFDGACSVDYRLSPAVKHPQHFIDVMSAVLYVLKTYDPSRIVVVGHSAGAFLAGQVASFLELTGKLEQSFALEGIYSLIDLVKEYPSYRSFVEEAFGPPSDWALATPRWHQLTAPITAVWSQQDELLSIKQVEWLASQVPHLEVRTIPDGGTHDQVFEQGYVASKIYSWLS